jgi:hypothetical protein
MGGAPTDIGPEMLDPGMVGPDGMPVDPGMEGEEEGFPPDAEGEDEGFPPGDDEEAGEDEGGFPPDDGGDEEDAPPPPKKDKGSKDKKSKSKKEGAYRTVSGDVLGEDAYIRHLAVLHSGGSPAVLAQLRAEASR